MTHTLKLALCALSVALTVGACRDSTPEIAPATPALASDGGSNHEARASQSATFTKESTASMATAEEMSAGTEISATVPPPTTISTPTKTPTNTRTPEPTVPPPTATPTAVSFSLEEAERSVPNDVLEEVFLAPGGGGGGSSCGNGDQEPLVSPDRSVEPNEIALLIVCNWQSSEVSVDVVYPDGQEKAFQGELRPADGGASSLLLLRFQPSIDDPVGIYSFKFPYRGTVREEVFEVMQPKGPRLYTYADERKQLTGRLQLYNFQPNENVRLFAYQRDEFFQGHLTGWKEYQVDANGQTMILVPPAADINYAAIGDLSGEAESYLVNSVIGLLPVFTEEYSISR